MRVHAHSAPLPPLNRQPGSLPHPGGRNPEGGIRHIPPFFGVTLVADPLVAFGLFASESVAPTDRNPVRRTITHIVLRDFSTKSVARSQAGILAFMISSPGRRSRGSERAVCSPPPPPCCCSTGRLVLLAMSRPSRIRYAPQYGRYCSGLKPRFLAHAMHCWVGSSLHFAGSFFCATAGD